MYELGISLVMRASRTRFAIYGQKIRLNVSMKLSFPKNDASLTDLRSLYSNWVSSNIINGDPQSVNNATKNGQKYWMTNIIAY